MCSQIYSFLISIQCLQQIKLPTKDIGVQLCLLVQSSLVMRFVAWESQIDMALQFGLRSRLIAVPRIHWSCTSNCNFAQRLLQLWLECCPGSPATSAVFQWIEGLFLLVTVRKSEYYDMYRHNKRDEECLWLQAIRADMITPSLRLQGKVREVHLTRNPCLPVRALSARGCKAAWSKSPLPVTIRTESMLQAHGAKHSWGPAASASTSLSVLLM